MNRRHLRNFAALLIVASGAVVWSARETLQNWYRLWSGFEQLGRDQYGVVRYRHRETGLVMALVRGATVLRAQGDLSAPAIAQGRGDHFRLYTREGDESYDLELLAGDFLVSTVVLDDYGSVEFLGGAKNTDAVAERCQSIGLDLPNGTLWLYAGRVAAAYWDRPVPPDDYESVCEGRPRPMFFLRPPRAVPSE